MKVTDTFLVCHDILWELRFFESTEHMRFGHAIFLSGKAFGMSYYVQPNVTT